MWVKLCTEHRSDTMIWHIDSVHAQGLVSRQYSPLEEVSTLPQLQCVHAGGGGGDRSISLVINPES